MPTTRKNLADQKTESNGENDSVEKVLVLLNELNEEIDINHRNIEEKIDNQLSKHSEELSRNMKEFETNMDDKLQFISSSHSMQIEELARVIENNETISKLNDVILKGIPTETNENLVAIFDQISLAIGFIAKSSAVNNIFRLGNGADTNRNMPIIVKFLTIISQQQFMSKYFGCESDDRIYASHNLTKFNFEIQQLAVKMLKEKKVSKIHTRAGLVHVKFNDETGFVKILHPNDLEKQTMSRMNVYL